MRYPACWLGLCATPARFPRVRYNALYRSHRRHGINPQIAELIQRCCAFSKLLLALA
ncbi:MULTISPECIES: hypothetical protein [Pseudomonas]|uniref:hypothetical protein n=1 Tax=Pseudomonas TaxID=286 RepID=UPI001E3FE7BB|nr:MULTISPECIES: hypothetical protein [Pseudomonas]MCE1114639.1 hypothetical protein [Pseudomonas sp. NMI795_08]